MMNLNELPNRLPDEKIVLFLRRHWIELVRTFIFSFILLLLPVVIGLIVNAVNPNLIQSVFWGPTIVATLITYLLTILVLTFTELTDYWLDVWIVTNERIINAEQKGLFNRVVSEVYLYQIQDVTSETKGFFATFLTFGDVFVQTAGEHERFEFKNIDNPDDVKITIAGLAKVCKNNHTHTESHVSTPEAEREKR